MSKKQTKTTTETKIAGVKKGEIYETKHQELLEVVNGRSKDEGELGTSFEGRSITFNTESSKVERSKTTDRFYLDDLARKLTKPEYDKWVATGCPEAEAARLPQQPQKLPQ